MRKANMPASEKLARRSVAVMAVEAAADVASPVVVDAAAGKGEAAEGEEGLDTGRQQEGGGRRQPRDGKQPAIVHDLACHNGFAQGRMPGVNAGMPGMSFVPSPSSIRFRLFQNDA
jgi:hypothetical protein